MTLQWWIGLAGWVLQDGNHTDFVTGERRQFALEFWERRGHRLQPTPGATAPGCRHTGRDAWYDVAGSLRRIPGRRGATHVLDVAVSAYHESPYEDLDESVDDVWMSGEIGLGVDYFAYMDDLVGLPGMPPLIYTWSIDEIRHTLASRDDEDPARTPWRTIDRTRTWEDGGDYLLRCTLLDEEPVSSMAATGPRSPYVPPT